MRGRPPPFVPPKPPAVLEHLVYKLRGESVGSQFLDVRIIEVPALDTNAPPDLFLPIDPPLDCITDVVYT